MLKMVKEEKQEKRDLRRKEGERRAFLVGSDIIG